MKKSLIITIFLAGLLSGCSLADLSASMKADRYMESGDYRQAEVEFKEVVRERPDSPVAHYYLGRFLMAQHKAAEALPQFQRAVALAPDNADYHFWLGLTFGELGDGRNEKAGYERALRLDKDNAQAQLYLGHIQLRNGELHQALASYDAVLKKVPTNGAALYNRALILDMEKKQAEAQKAWLEYLKWFPAGKFASRAADHLNALGDFSYENHYLGRRTVTLADIKFARSGKELIMSANPSLKLVGTIVANLRKGEVQVVVYVENNKELAKERALRVKKTMNELVPELRPERIRVSWFDVTEKITIDHKDYVRPEAVRIFLTDWQ
jgi:tetratricopeptide (TPR) repeat protein